MPEASDIQQALQPLVKSMDKLEQQYERLIGRIDALPNIYMTRNEYEPRHKTLQDDIVDLREDNKALKAALESRNQTTRILAAGVIAAIITAVATLIAPFLK